MAMGLQPLVLRFLVLGVAGLIAGMLLVACDPSVSPPHAVVRGDGTPLLGGVQTDDPT